MKTVDGVNYYGINEVAKQLDRTAQSIKIWYKWAAEQPEDVQNLLPPVRRDIDARGTYYFDEEGIEKLQAFREQISYGLMSSYTQTRWGKRGKEIGERKKQKELQKQ